MENQQNLDTTYAEYMIRKAYLDGLKAGERNSTRSNFGKGFLLTLAGGSLIYLSYKYILPYNIKIKVEKRR